MSFSRRGTSERNDITVRILDVEILRSPFRWGEWPQNGYAIRHASLIEGFDSIYAGCCIEMLLLTPVLTLDGILGRFFQMQLQPVELSDRVEALPRLAK